MSTKAGELQLDRSDEPVDEITWDVGYENIAFFRRVFKRLTGVTPSISRRRFQVPELVQTQLETVVS